ncbi:MAG TPA: diacylglycerol kinase family protein [Candidatus Limnocylindria bacterium]|nr:diacylglycerol kinase family protein [Candidatus Limnocylindria bacterium]
MTLVHNPSAGEGRPSAKDLTAILTEAGLQTRYVSSDEDWKKAVAKRTDVVVAAGGDGTVAKVLLRMQQRPTPVALLPLGTANNVARTLGVIGDVREIAGSWRVAAVSPFDVGRLRAPWGEAHFVESFGGGAFAETILRGREEVENSKAIAGPESDRALLLLREIVQAARPRRWRVAVDGQDLSGDYLAVEALNTRFVGPNVPLAPAADPGDGLLDLVLIGEADREALLEHLNGRLELAAALPPRLAAHRGRRIELAVEAPFPPLHLDDDVIGQELGSLARATEAAFVLDLDPGAVKLLGAELPAAPAER